MIWEELYIMKKLYLCLILSIISENFYSSSHASSSEDSHSSSRIIVDFDRSTMKYTESGLDNLFPHKVSEESIEYSSSNQYSTQRNLHRCEAFKDIIINSILKDREEYTKRNSIEKISYSFSNNESEENSSTTRESLLSSSVSSQPTSLIDKLHDMFHNDNDVHISEKDRISNELTSFLEDFKHLEPLVKKAAEIRYGYTTQKFKDINEYKGPKITTSIFDIMIGVGVDITKILTAYYSEYAWLSHLLVAISILDGLVTSADYYYTSKIQAIFSWFTNDYIVGNHNFSNEYQEKTSDCVVNLSFIAKNILKHIRNNKNISLTPENENLILSIESILNEFKQDKSSSNIIIYSIKGLSVASGILSGIIGGILGQNSMVSRWTTTTSVGLAALTDRLSSMKLTSKTFSRNMALSTLYILCWEAKDILPDEDPKEEV